MKNVMRVIREAHNVERRRQTARNEMAEESSKRTQEAKSFVTEIGKKEIKNEEMKRRIDEIFGKGNRKEMRI